MSESSLELEPGRYWKLVQSSSKVYLEMYTAILMISNEKLSQFFKKEITVADREFVESGCDVMIEQAKTEEPKHTGNLSGHCLHSDIEDASNYGFHSK